MILPPPLRHAAVASTLLLVLAAVAGAQAPDQPGPLAAPFVEAYRRYAAGDPAGAVGILEPLGERVAQNPQTASLLAAAYLDLGRAADAAALLDPLAAQPAAGPAVLFNAARAALALGQQGRADELLARAVAKEPASQAARALGLRRGRQGRYEEAYQLLQPWLAAHPDDHEARLARAFAAQETGRHLEVGELLAPLPADRPEVTLLAARALLSQGKPHDVIAQLTPLAAAPPPALERDLRWTLGEALLQIGQASAAVDLLAGETGNDPALTLKLLQAYQQAGQPEQVLIAGAPFAPALADLGSIAPEARATFAGIALEQGRALAAGRRWPEAVVALQASTTLDPARPVGWQLLAQALRGAGRAEESAAALARFQELSRSDGGR